MSTTITMKKGSDGWEATSMIPFDAGRALHYSTVKGINGSLLTTASIVEPTDMGFKLVLTGSSADWFERVLVNKALRCTEKNVRAHHEAALADIDAHMADALAFYAARAPKVPEGWDKIEGDDEGDDEPCPYHAMDVAGGN